MIEGPSKTLHLLKTLHFDYLDKIPNLDKNGKFVTSGIFSFFPFDSINKELLKAAKIQNEKKYDLFKLFQSALKEKKLEIKNLQHYKSIIETYITKAVSTKGPNATLYANTILKNIIPLIPNYTLKKGRFHPELLRMIFSYFAINELNTMALTCKYWKKEARKVQMTKLLEKCSKDQPILTINYKVGNKLKQEFILHHKFETFQSFATFILCQLKQDENLANEFLGKLFLTLAQYSIKSQCNAFTLFLNSIVAYTDIQEHKTLEIVRYLANHPKIPPQLKLILFSKAINVFIFSIPHPFQNIAAFSPIEDGGCLMPPVKYKEPKEWYAAKSKVCQRIYVSSKNKFSPGEFVVFVEHGFNDKNEINRFKSLWIGQVAEEVGVVRFESQYSVLTKYNFKQKQWLEPIKLNASEIGKIIKQRDQELI